MYEIRLLYLAYFKGGVKTGLFDIFKMNSLIEL